MGLDRRNGHWGLKRGWQASHLRWLMTADGTQVVHFMWRREPSAPVVGKVDRGGLVAAVRSGVMGAVSHCEGGGFQVRW